MINTPTTESENKISSPVVADQIQYRKRIFDKLKLEDKDKIWYAHHKYMDIVNELEPLFNNFSAENIGTSKTGNGADRNFGRMDWFFPKKNKEKIYEALAKVKIGQGYVTKTLREDYGIDHSREKNQVTGYDIIFGDQGLSDKFMSLLKKIGKQEAAQLVSDLKNEIKVYQICNNLMIEGDSKSIKLLMNFFDETYGKKILDTEKITAFGTHISNVVENKENGPGLRSRIMIISDFLSEEYEGDKGIWNSSKIIKHELKHSIDKTIGINYMGYNKYADNFEIEKVLAMEILAFDWQDSNISKKELGTILINGYLREVTMIQKEENMFINVNNSGQYSIDRTKEYSFTGKSIEGSIRKQADGFCEKLNGLLYALHGLKNTSIEYPDIGLNEKKINILLSITPASMWKKLSGYYSDLGKNILVSKIKAGYKPLIQYNGPTEFYKTNEELKELALKRTVQSSWRGITE